MTRDVTEQIERGSLAPGKTDEAHDATRPAQMWFPESDGGEIVFLAFYNQACSLRSA